MSCDNCETALQNLYLFLDEEIENRTKDPGVAVGLAWTPARADPADGWQLEGGASIGLGSNAFSPLGSGQRSLRLPAGLARLVVSSDPARGDIGCH